MKRNTMETLPPQKKKFKKKKKKKTTKKKELMTQESKGVINYMIQNELISIIYCSPTLLSIAFDFTQETEVIENTSFDPKTILQWINRLINNYSAYTVISIYSTEPASHQICKKR